MMWGWTSRYLELTLWFGSCGVGKSCFGNMYVYSTSRIGDPPIEHQNKLHILIHWTPFVINRAPQPPLLDRLNEKYSGFEQLETWNIRYFSTKKCLTVLLGKKFSRIWLILTVYVKPWIIQPLWHPRAIFSIILVCLGWGSNVTCLAQGHCWRYILGPFYVFCWSYIDGCIEVGFLLSLRVFWFCVFFECVLILVVGSCILRV